ncbi:Platelet endothelial aggregation receptor 1 [Chelonia mydas]|uniref:Platelet endothelial aggregation receptor 1 n=1 Tax=Chelonia mydas TaxID=8469 RepID=M7BGZ5_CHEMY|nr:Platelet endothelial aggregation receptor 1 [Chelonia mydas]
MHLATPLNPSDPNVCSYWESFTTATKESYAHPYAQASKDSCDGTWSFLKPCTQHKLTPAQPPNSRVPQADPIPNKHRIVYKTAYRQAVKIDYRKRYRCCQGYYESADVCVPSCTKECVHGRCVAPDQCQCEQGWRGTDCSSVCDARSWGPRCENACQCGDGGACDPLTGACVCLPGYKDPVCKDPCDPRTYGKGCQLDCPCKNGAKCHRETGACLCQPGFTGAYCELLCLNGSDGLHCPAHCPCQNGGICHPPNTTRCVCPPGWMGAICSVPCPQGWYGSGCLGECQCHNKGVCDPVTGRCQCALGYTGERCREECPIGKYGQDCGQPCDCANGGRCFHINGACHPMSGECTCKPGWAGLHCNETCPHGYYGANCQEPCLCLNGGTCDGTTGLCHCAPGYTGEHCSSHCPADTYGVNCSMQCACKNAFACSPIDGTCVCKEACPPGRYGKKCAMSCRCSNHSTCHLVDGSCDCFPGWTGSDCSQPCPPGTWGAACSHTCRCPNGGLCNTVDGTCSCPAGLTGRRCSEGCPLGRYGENCAQACQCQDKAQCDPATGRCLCPSGYTGTHCETKCPPGTFGPRCLQVCECLHNSTCHHVTGSCQCEPGRSGAQCEKWSPEHPFTMVPAVPVGYSSLGAIIGIIVLVILLLALLVFFLCYRHWQKGKENRHLAVAYTTGRTDSSEYAVPDVPPSYTHYYSNPSYHTLSRCVPTSPAPNSQDRASSLKVPCNQHFSSIKTVAYGPDCNASLPADWKHHGAPALKHRERGGGPMDRSYSYSNSLGKYYGNDYIKEEALRASNSSLNSENPYATIKDLPELMAKPSEGSYMEMKSPVKREMSYAEIGLFEEPAAGSRAEESCPPGAEGVSPAAPSIPPNHYDSPKNSHIPSHYDMPPVRHYPPSPPLRRQDRALKSVTMGKKGDRGAKDKVAGVSLEEEGKNAAKRTDQHGEEEYQCTGLLEQDFNELCSRAGLTRIPKVTVRLQSVCNLFLPEESDTLAEKEVPANLTQIQSKYAYFQPCIQTEVEHDDPKSTREIFLRGWKIEERMLAVFSKCLPALANLQAVHLWKVGLTDLSLLSLIAILPNCPNLKLAHVSLRNNNIGNADAKLIGQALSTLKSSNKSLVSLTLSFNHISDLGAGYIAEVLGPFALTHTEVVERRRLLLEKESQERSRSPLRHADAKSSERPSSLVSNTTIDKLQSAKQSKSGSKKKEPSKKEEKAQANTAGGGGVVGGPAFVPAKKEDAKQAKKTVSTPEQKVIRGKGTKSGAKEKRSLPPELEVVEPTEIVNPLLEQAEHRDGKVFLPGNRVLISLNLTWNQITEQGLKAFLAAMESQQQASKSTAGVKSQTGLLRLSLGKNHFPPDSKTFAKLQELMLPRDPTYSQLSKAPDEELAVPS